MTELTLLSSVGIFIGLIAFYFLSKVTVYMYKNYIIFPYLDRQEAKLLREKEDLEFHESRGGVRAQYYIREELKVKVRALYLKNFKHGRTIGDDLWIP